jgi:N6-adenosine-specific RNA methylase IME4
MSDPFANLPRNHFGAILADPAWRFKTWNKASAVQKRGSKSTYLPATAHYNTMTAEDICALPVPSLTADNCALFLWTSWPMLKEAFQVIEAWGFEYKTCGFDWMKAHSGQLEMFPR